MGRQVEVIVGCCLRSKCMRCLQQISAYPTAAHHLGSCCGCSSWSQCYHDSPDPQRCAYSPHSSPGQSPLRAALKVLAGAYPASLDDEETDRVLITLLELGISAFVCLQAEVSLNTPEKSWRTGRGLRSACVPCSACPSVPHHCLLYGSTSCPALLL